MASLMKFSWWQWIPIWSWRIVGIVDAADEVPASLPHNSVVYVGTPDNPKWLAFDCPCRSGHRIMLNLDVSHFPHWDILDAARLTLSPSIDFNSPGRRCHFFIRQKKIMWTRD